MLQRYDLRRIITYDVYPVHYYNIERYKKNKEKRRFKLSEVYVASTIEAGAKKTCFLSAANSFMSPWRLWEHIAGVSR